MPYESVVVSAGGPPFASWTEIRVEASVKHAARALMLTLVDTVGAPQWPAAFPIGKLVTVTSGGDLLFTGYVDRWRPSLRETEYKVEIYARAKGQDAVDSSVDHTKPDYVGQNVLSVAQDQDQFGIGFTCDFSPDGFDRWRPNVGASVFEALRPLAEDEGATLSGQADGSVLITRAGETATPQAGYLQEGVNCWRLSADFDFSGQHSKVKAHGQSYKGKGSANLEIKAEADNDNLGRYRPVVEHHDRQTDNARLTRRAKRRRDKEQGEGIRAEVDVLGWRDSGGTLWTPGKTIFVVAPSLVLAQTMLIESVHYTQSGQESQGTGAKLHLVDPRAHGGKGGGVNKSGASWGFDDSAAT